jgi:hypothetical protein
MPTLKHEITIENSCSLIRKSKDVFAPIKEAITNSFDAITHRQESTDKTFEPAITLSVHFKSDENSLLSEKAHILDFVSVEDNGIGFTQENINRFKKLAENTKGLNNKGTGKIQIFHRFHKITINSIFTENNRQNELNFFCTKTGNYKEVLTEVENSDEIKTIIKMEEFNGNEKELRFFAKYLNGIDEFKRDVMKHFLLRLWIGISQHNLTFTIKVFLDNKEQSKFVFNQKNTVTPDKELKIYVNTEQGEIVPKDKNHPVKWSVVEPKHEITIQRFKLPEKETEENGIYLCSKDIVVRPFKFPVIRKNATFEGFRYLICISGSILDNPQNINQSGNKFTFPLKREIEEEFMNSLPIFLEDTYIFWEEVENQINKGLIDIFSDVENITEKRKKYIIELAEKYGIALEIAEVLDVAFNETDEKITEKLFTAQAKRSADQSIKIQKDYEKLKQLKTSKLNPTDKEYRNKFEELSNSLLTLIPQQNKEELARYVIRRDMVVRLLEFALDNKLSIQKEWTKKKHDGKKIRKDNEGLIHDLIFKRRNKGIPNDLWILNEEFVHFDGCSDLRLEEIEVNGQKLLKDKIEIDEALQQVDITKDSYVQTRPDIFLFPEEGKCILIEFKAPDVPLVSHCDQIQKYAKLIANFSRIKFNQFFGFLIGETINEASIPGRYNKVPYCKYWVYPNEVIKSIDEASAPIANLYQEIILLSEIAKRAEIRNRSFAEKLGIKGNHDEI